MFPRLLAGGRAQDVDVEARRRCLHDPVRTNIALEAGVEQVVAGGVDLGEQEVVGLPAAASNATTPKLPKFSAS